MITQQPEIVHATAIAINGHGVLLTGSTGAGKSDLALRLIDRGAVLISDDQTELHGNSDTILLHAPANIAGKLEIRSLGIVATDHVSGVPLRLKVQLAEQPERFPMDQQTETIKGVRISSIAINAFEHSAPLKVEIALTQLLDRESKS
ncbi:MAG: HPr kinase/phosphatase C-terminal domain-containing protein [Pseudomonadota bacterium]